MQPIDLVMWIAMFCFCASFIGFCISLRTVPTAIQQGSGEMFDSIAKHYDLANNAMSLGQHLKVAYVPLLF
mgnify:FL=1|jgi:hypothetical protein